MTLLLDHSTGSSPYAGLSINSAKRLLVNQFREAGLETPDLDARILLMHASELSHADLIARGTECLSPEISERIIKCSQCRLAGEPIDHILGYREFYGRRFEVTKDVLSPRPETEMLVDAALNILKETPTGTFLDLGTGSGAIAISILAEMPQAHGIAIDVSETALKIAMKNAAQHNVMDRLNCLQGSWFEPVTERFDIILSNPPYITDKAMDELGTEVKEFDPDLSLRGGPDGLIAYLAIISQAANHFNAGGTLLFEIGYDQGESVTSLLKEAGFLDISVSQDLADHDRMIKALYPA